jgi:hypothetical protein
MARSRVEYYINICKKFLIFLTFSDPALDTMFFAHWLPEQYWACKAARKFYRHQCCLFGSKDWGLRVFLGNMINVSTRGGNLRRNSVHTSANLSTVPSMPSKHLDSLQIARNMWFPSPCWREDFCWVLSSASFEKGSQARPFQSWRILRNCARLFAIEYLAMGLIQSLEN